MLDTHVRTLTVSEVIDDRPLGGFQRLTIALCGLVLLLDGFDTQSMGFLVPPISEALGIPLSAFGPVFSAGLIGLMIGAMLAGPIADRWGRKPAIIISTLTFGAFSIATASAGSLNQLVALRLLTGLGLGGAMPNVVSLASEFAPKRLQTILVTWIFAGMALGAILASLLASVMIPLWGWRSVFYAGGVLPISLAILLIKVLPESPRYLSLRNATPARLAAILRRLAPELGDAPFNVAASSEIRVEGLPVKHLFTEGRAAGTLMLWIPFFMNLLILYFILSWTPALLRQAGMPVSAGITAVLSFSIGGVVGVLIQGPLMRAVGYLVAMLLEFIVTLGLVWLASTIFTNFALMMVVVFILGVSVQGAQAGINVLSAMFYPTAMRSTGVGWALGVGRIGSIVGPLIGGLMLSMLWTPQQIFMAGTVPALLAVLAVAASSRLKGLSPYRM